MRRLGVTVVALGVLVAGCSSLTGPRIDVPGKDNGAAGSTLENVAVGTSIIVPLGSLCTTGKPVRITDVTAEDATGGLRITSWGTRYLGPQNADAAEDNQGNIPGVVSTIAGFGSRNAVRSRCVSDEEAERQAARGEDETDQFDVSVAAHAPRATMSGVVVHFGDGQTVMSRFFFALCSTKTCPFD